MFTTVIGCWIIGKHDISRTIAWYSEELKYAYKNNNKRAVKCAEALLLKEILAE